MKVRAFLWDFDGTLADTRRKNYNVTRRILAQFHPEVAARAPAASDPEEYDQAARRLSNWREFYTGYLGLSEAETDEAGRLWTRFQLEDETPVPLIDGVAETLERLRGQTHGVVSQNSRSVIENALAASGLNGLFGSVIGYEEVPIRRQKPEPDGILMGLEQLERLEPGAVLFVGDHPTDMHTAANANREFQRRGLEIRVVSVAAAYSCPTWREWPHAPDEVAHHPLDVLEIAKWAE